MAEKQRKTVGRWVALGTVLGVVAVWGGFGLVGAATSAPLAITTCTKASNNKTKVIATSDVAKCTAKGKGVAKNWADARYARFDRWQQCILLNSSHPSFCGSNDFSGLDFSLSFLPDRIFDHGNFIGVNFRGAIMTDTFSAVGANFSGANFTNAALTTAATGHWAGANFAGAIWNNTTCPDGSVSDGDGGTCVNNLNP